MIRSVWFAAAVVFVAGDIAPAAAQVRSAAPDRIALSLTQALDRALGRSEEVRLARAQLDQAAAQAQAARSAYLPQLNTQIAYTRTLRSVFQGAGFQVPDSLRFDPDPTRSLEQRVRYLETATPNAAFGALGGLFSDLPFGRENTWVGGVALNQPLFAGGRIQSSVAAADRAADAARASVDEASAEIAFQVKQAYYGAVLAEESATIVQASVELARQHFERVQRLLDAGRASDLELLRAEVEVENLRPELVRARNARDVALLDLKRLVNVPMDAVVELTTTLDSPSAGEAVRLPSLEEAAPLLGRRAAVRAAEAQVALGEEQVDIAASAYLPTVSLTGNMNWQAFPSGTFPVNDDWRGDWNLGVAVQWPLFEGFRRDADIEAAEAQVEQAELRLDQLREQIQLDYERALGELDRARAQIEAAGRTVAQAERVYELTQLRFREGVATQLDVSDARLALQQARMNRAQADHDFQIALARAQRALGAPSVAAR